MQQFLDMFQNMSVEELENVLVQGHGILEDKKRAERERAEKARRRQEEIEMLQKRLAELQAEEDAAPAPKAKPAEPFTIICPHCGKALAPDSRFCCFCGKTL